jgi:thioredoxin reductase (NADPH)
MSAAIACAKAGLRTQLIEQLGFGGELINVPHVVEHGPPAKTGLEISGELTSELMAAGVACLLISACELRHRPDAQAWEIITSDGLVDASQVVLATGCQPRRLDVEGAARLEGRGVSYCAPCDGPMFAGGVVALVADSRWALGEALCLADLAAQVHVIVADAEQVHGAARLAEVSARANTTIVHGTALEILGEERVAGILVETADGPERIPVSAVFGCIGRVPSSELAVEWADVQPDGRLLTDAALRCRTPGLMAIGDVRVAPDQTARAAIADGQAVARTALEHAAGLRP